MEETLEGGRGPPRAVEPLERENFFQDVLNMCGLQLFVIKVFESITNGLETIYVKKINLKTCNFKFWTFFQ